jgi:hypothetical protein
MRSCCFIGHRKIEDKMQVEERLREIVKLLINRGVNVFYFGSRSEFDDLALKVVTDFKQEYANIRRVYVRSIYESISGFYQAYLLKSFGDTFMPDSAKNAGIASYVKRNQAMINESDICVFYYREDYLPKKRKNSRRGIIDYQPKSGTKIAFEYAKRKNKEIINIVTY